MAAALSAPPTCPVIVKLTFSLTGNGSRGRGVPEITGCSCCRGVFDKWGGSVGAGDSVEMEMGGLQAARNKTEIRMTLVKIGYCLMGYL
jgi:hypothetical protein